MGVAKRCAHQEPSESGGARQPELYYRVHSLLHTVRLIGQHEDQLCSLLHEVETAGKGTPVINQELRTLLDEIPSIEYQQELNALHESLGEWKQVARTRVRAKTAAKRSVTKARRQS